jgi:hypothetical protein
MVICDIYRLLDLHLLVTSPEERKTYLVASVVCSKPFQDVLNLVVLEHTLALTGLRAYAEFVYAF